MIFSTKTCKEMFDCQGFSTKTEKRLKFSTKTPYKHVPVQKRHKQNLISNLKRESLRKFYVYLSRRKFTNV